MTPTAIELDPITYEVVQHRLYSINEEGGTTIVHASGSPVVHATDYNFGIFTADGDLAVSGVFYMLAEFPVQILIKKTIEKYADDVHPGDVFVSNDPFLAGVHQNDVQMVAPFFHDGELIAWTGCMAHVMDVGGMEPGSWCPSATDMFQEGFLISLSRIVSAGKLNQDLWDVVMANSRMPAMVANDCNAFLSAHRVSHARLGEACDQYGAETIAATMSTAIDRTERRMREWLATMPDGRFEHVGYLDHDGHANNLYEVRCALTKDGDSIVFDFEGTDPQIIGMGNATASGTFGAVATIIMGVFGSALPWNAGLLRALEVRTPPGSVVAAQPPAPISAGSAGATWVATGAAAICIAKLLAFSDEHRDFVCPAADGSWILGIYGGLNQYGEPFATMVMDSLGWGGPPFDFRDGVDVGGSLVVIGGGFNDVEHDEHNSPLLHLWRREAIDSGGAGRFRGGNGIEFAIAVHDSTDLAAVIGTHGVVVPNNIGVQGAYPGGCGGYERVSASDWTQRMGGGEVLSALDQLSGEHDTPEAKCRLTVRAGDVVNHWTENAGGFGDPLERDVQRVLDDVLDGHVSRETAHAVYGVVLDGGDQVGDRDKGRVSDLGADAAASGRRRDEMRAARLEDLENARDDYEVRDDLPVEHVWGDVLNLVRDGGELLVQVQGSGVILGPLGESWRDVAPWRRIAAGELGPRLRVDERLEVRQYVDPQTGRSLWVDVIRTGDRLPKDFVLKT